MTSCSIICHLAKLCRWHFPLLIFISFSLNSCSRSNNHNGNIKMDKESTGFTTGSLVKLPSSGTVPEPTLQSPKTLGFLPSPGHREHHPARHAEPARATVATGAKGPPSAAGAGRALLRPPNATSCARTAPQQAPPPLADCHLTCP